MDLTQNKEKIKEFQERARKIIKRIPNHKLIMADHLMSGMAGNFGAAYQDFENDVYSGLEQGAEKLEKIGNLKVIAMPTSLYWPVIKKKVTGFCQEHGIDVEFLSEAPSTVRKGDAFLILTSQLDSGLIALVDNAKGLKVGTDYHIISYNDSPVDRVVVRCQIPTQDKVVGTWRFQQHPKQSLLFNMFSNCSSSFAIRNSSKDIG